MPIPLSRCTLYLDIARVQTGVLGTLIARVSPHWGCDVIIVLKYLFLLRSNCTAADHANTPNEEALFSCTCGEKESTLFLAALRVFLQHNHGGPACSQRLESTRNLSVASLRTCEECRGATAFHVRIGNNTPCSLWATGCSASISNVSPASPFGVCATPACGAGTRVLMPLRTRVPAVMIAKISWEKSSTDELMLSRDNNVLFPALSSATEIAFGEAFNWSVTNVAWPGGLQRLTFGSSFNMPLLQVSWPPGLQDITFGKLFNHSVDGVAWPCGLERLTFGHGFNQSCAATAWPARLREVTFGCEYNRAVSSVTWPDLLQRLSFGRNFNQPINRDVHWPSSLRVLTLGWHFNQCLRGCVLPQTLEILILMGVYNRSLDGIHLPPGLKKLVLGGHFNQPLDSVRWPEYLEELIFGWAFNQPLFGVDWPPVLTKLVLGYQFNQPSDRVKWPAQMEALELGVFSRQSLEGLIWPASFRILTVGRGFDLTGMALPESARVCRHGHRYCP